MGNVGYSLTPSRWEHTFIPPQSEILIICANNLQAAKILLNRVNQSTLTGLVKRRQYLTSGSCRSLYNTELTIPELTGNPMKVMQHSEGIIDFLQNGNYTVTFSAYGYIPQTFNNVNINSVGQTILNVNLVPAMTVSVTGVVTDLATGLPIQGATIEVMNTPVPPVTTNALGEYTIPSM